MSKLFSTIASETDINTSSKTIEQTIQVEKSMDIPLVDKRSYSQFILLNGIRTTVVHDGNSEKSSCCLGISAGASLDTLPGIAHITEHAVFLGSSKYPIENAYKDFLNKNGGGSNGGTGMEMTTYKFQVNSQAFKHALDIFSQFFKSPLLDVNAISREIMAVDAEDSKNRIIDGRRTLQVLKYVMNKNSNYTKFSTGNLQTLAMNNISEFGQQLTNEIQQYHHNYYQPDCMSLCLVGPQSIDELRLLAIEMFADIQPFQINSDNNSTIQLSNTVKETTTTTNPDGSFHQSLFTLNGQSMYNKLIRMKPIKDVRDIEIIWQFPPTKHLYKNNPLALLGYLIGHKGKGSLFSALQDLGWAFSTSAGVRTSFSTEFTLFECSVSLTPLGFQNYSQIIRMIYYYIDRVVRRNALSEEIQRVWKELIDISAMNFQYQEKTSAYELAPELAARMLDYPFEHILSAEWLLDPINTTQLVEYLDHFKVDNSLMFLRSSEFQYLPKDSSVRSEIQMDQIPSNEVLEVETYYGVPFTVEDVKTQGFDENFKDIERLLHEGPNSIELHLPEPNKFICDTLSLSVNAIEDGHNPSKLRSTQPEKLLIQESTDTAPVGINTSIWYSKDEVFNQPRAIVYVSFDSLFERDGHPIQSLYSSIFAQVTARKYYLSRVAGLSYDFFIGRRGIHMNFHGFTNKLSELVNEISKEVGDIEWWRSHVNQDLFTICKERLLRNLKSWMKERSDSQCGTLLNYLLMDGVWLPSEKITAIEEQSDLATFLHRMDNILKNIYTYTLYSHGAIMKDQAISLASTLSNDLISKNANALSTFDQPLLEIDRTRLLQPDHHQVVALPTFNPTESNSALLTYIQADRSSPKTSAVLLCLRRLLAEPAFTELRTKKQLGYIVSLSIEGFGKRLDSVRGISIRILSKRFSPVVMENELGTFLESFQDHLTNALTKDEVESLTNSIIKSLQDPPTTYIEEANDFWMAIRNEMPFNWTELIIDELKRLDPHDIHEAASRWIYQKETRKSISFMLFCSEHQADQNNLLNPSNALESNFFSTSNGTSIHKSLEELASLRDRLEYLEIIEK